MSQAKIRKEHRKYRKPTKTITDYKFKQQWKQIAKTKVIKKWRQNINVGALALWGIDALTPQLIITFLPPKKYFSFLTE